MNLLDEIKEIVEVKVQIKPDLLADKLFDKGVYPLLIKLTDIIPTNLDDALLAKHQHDLKAQFRELLQAGVEAAESKLGVDLDGKE